MMKTVWAGFRHFFAFDRRQAVHEDRTFFSCLFHKLSIDLIGLKKNMANSLMIGCSKVGVDFAIIAPKSLWPTERLIGLCKDPDNYPNVATITAFIVCNRFSASSNTTLASLSKTSSFKQEHVEALAKYSNVPVWNGLTDEYHPTQIPSSLSAPPPDPAGTRSPLAYNPSM